AADEAGGIFRPEVLRFVGEGVPQDVGDGVLDILDWRIDDPHVEDGAAWTRFDRLEHAPAQRHLLVLLVRAFREPFLHTRYIRFEVGGLVRLDLTEDDAGGGRELARGGDGGRRRRGRLTGCGGGRGCAGRRLLRRKFWTRSLRRGGRTRREHRHDNKET